MGPLAAETIAGRAAGQISVRPLIQQRRAAALPDSPHRAIPAHRVSIRDNPDGPKILLA